MSDVIGLVIPTRLLSGPAAETRSTSTFASTVRISVPSGPIVRIGALSAEDIVVVAPEVWSVPSVQPAPQV